MSNLKKIKLVFMLCIFNLSTYAYAVPSVFSVNKNSATEAKVYLDFDKNEGASVINYGYDPYGTYLTGFPSMNDNGDIAGRTAYTYIHPHTGNEITQLEASVWVDGLIHRFGVLNCSTSNCQSRALKLNNARSIIVGASHGATAATTQYFERSIKWQSSGASWSTQYGLLENTVQSSIEDVNDQGSIVGSALTDLDYVRHAQTIINGVKYTIGAANAQSLGVAINNSNNIVGSILDNGVVNAFFWNPDQNVDSPALLPSLSGGYTIAYDINDAGVIVGSSIDTMKNNKAVMWRGMNVFDLGTLGGDMSVARSINNSDVVVGYSQTADGEKHGFIYQDAAIFDLNNYILPESGWVIVDAYTVNQYGQILVRAQNNRSKKAEDNAYWVLSPQGFVERAKPVMTAGNGPCQWGAFNCDVIYPPVAVQNSIYQMPVGPLPTFALSEIPFGDSYVCYTNCDAYASLSPMYATINEAVNNTPSNGKIIIFPGEYRESVAISLIELMGLNREYTVINSDSMIARPMRLQGLTKISGLTLTGGVALDGGGIQVSGGFNVIDNCVIQGNTASRNGGGIHSLMYSAFELHNSIVSNNKAKYGGGFLNWGYGNARIEHNKFIFNSAMYGAGGLFGAYANIYFNGNIVDSNTATKDGGGIYVNNNTDDRNIRNSVITNNYASGFGGGVNSGRLLGSVVYGNEAGIIRYSAVYSTSAKNSIIWGNAGTSVSSGVGSSIVEGVMYSCAYCVNVMNSDPLFVDAANGNFNLLPGSPAIDAGADTSNVFGEMQDDDFNGVKRGIDGDQQGASVGSDFDIGAFEYSPL